MEQKWDKVIIRFMFIFCFHCYILQFDHIFVPSFFGLFEFFCFCFGGTYGGARRRGGGEDPLLCLFDSFLCSIAKTFVMNRHAHPIANVY